MTSRLEINVSKDDRYLLSATSKGNQVKWRKDGFWLKANTVGYEDIAEFVAFNLLKCSSLHPSMYASYGLCTIREEVTQLYNGCYSHDFLGTNNSLVTFYRLFIDNGVDWEKLLNRKSTLDRVKAVITTVYDLTKLDITEYLRITLTLDALIYNEDRHLSNLAVIFNESTSFNFAPIFDNGLSCLANIKDYPLSDGNILLLRKVKARPFSTDFKKQMKVLGAGFTVNKAQFKHFLDIHREILGRVRGLMNFVMKENPAIFI